MVVAGALIGVFVVVRELETGGRDVPEKAGEPLPEMNLGEYELGDTESTDHPDKWRRLWSCKDPGCAPGEARIFTGPPCLSGRCLGLRIYDDSNGVRDSVGVSDWRDAQGGADGFGLTANVEGAIATYEWSVRFGKGFPRPPEEGSFLNVTEWHPTACGGPRGPMGFCQSPPLKISADSGRLEISSGGWDGSENVTTLWSCTLAEGPDPEVWYGIRVHVHWSAEAGSVTAFLDDPRTGAGPDTTCSRDDGMGTLYRDENLEPDEVWMAQNLYRGGPISDDTTLWYDNTRQACALAEDDHC